MNPNEFNQWTGIKITYTIQPFQMQKAPVKPNLDDFQDRLIEATLEGMKGEFPEAKKILDRIAFG